MAKDTIVIIGNGFDLAHGYKTPFKSFVEDKNGKNFKRFVHYLYGRKIANDEDKWTDFEKIICDSTMEIFKSEDNIIRIYKKTKCKNWNDFTNRIDTYFAYLSIEIMNYLNIIQSKHKFKPKNSIKKYLNNNSYIINFNYTDIAEQYTSNVFHIHGSIKEKDIILGYDHHNYDGNGESCVMEPNLMKRNKRFMRKTLDYKRYLRVKKLPDSKVNELGKQYLDYIVNCEGNLSGINTVFDGDYYKGFIKSPNYDAQIPIDIHFDDIRTIVIMGHSLLSDEKLIKESIINKCTNLKKFILFTYNYEKFKEIYKKAVFLNRLHPKTKIILKNTNTTMLKMFL